MSKRTRFIISGVCALVAIVACVLYASHVRAEVERERSETLRRYGGDTVTLVVATRALEPGEIVSRGDVSMRDWISSLAPANAFLSVDEVVGKKVSVPALANMPLCDMNFRDDTQAVEIPSGHVAVSVPITDTLGVPSSIAVGSHVLAYRMKDGTAESMGGDAIVLSVPGGTGLSAGRGSIVIAVDPALVAAILSASTSGDLKLVLPADDVREISQPAPASHDVMPVGEDAAKRDKEMEGNAEGHQQPVDAKEIPVTEGA